jgi:hypothetical protein
MAKQNIDVMAGERARRVHAHSAVSPTVVDPTDPRVRSPIVDPTDPRSGEAPLRATGQEPVHDPAAESPVSERELDPTESRHGEAAA